MKRTYHAYQLKKVMECIKQKIVYTQKNQQMRTYYTDLKMGFDIETTTLKNHNGYMYVWQFSVNDYTFIGRTWDEFIQFMGDLKSCVIRNKYSKARKCKAIIWVANLGFEFQFIRKRLKINKLFARRERQPLYFLANEIFEFRDCLAITGGSLAYLAENFTTTKKLVGDLDYSIERSYKTPLKFSECKYIINDVRILAEWADYIFKTYVVKHQLPLTKTGIIRDRIRSNIDEKTYKIIKHLFPGRKMYDYIMKWLFRGGYTHANAYLANITLTDILGIDFTSSYPYVMTHFKYPMSVFKEVDKMKFSDLDKYKDFDRYGYMMIIDLYDVDSITNHSLESVSKCIDIKGEFIDNGRVRSAKYMRVFLTNYDFEIYKILYRWNTEKSKIVSFWYCFVDVLPDYILNELHTCYGKKEELKAKGLKNTLEYTLAKVDTNANYGMCVTKLEMTEHVYKDDEWSTEESKKTFEQKVSTQFLSPMWGVWITSIARWNLLRFYDLNLFGNDVVYSDTDSDYLTNWRKHIPTIKKYNAEVEEKNMKYFSVRTETPELFKTLGTFDIDPINFKFKTLGAKRYIKTYWDNEKGIITSATVAGLPKESLHKWCNANDYDIYEKFQDDMTLDIEWSMKNAHTYNDDFHCDIVDGVLMSEYSSCGIYQTSFKMKLSDVYARFLIECEKEKNNGIYPE